MSVSTVADIIVVRNPNVTVDARVTDLITLATQDIGSVFGSKTNDAIALLVLHWIALDARAGGFAPGAIKSEKEGDLARSFGGSGSKTLTDLDSTSWGLQLKRLRNALIFSARDRTI